MAEPGCNMTKRSRTLIAVAVLTSVGGGHSICAAAESQDSVYQWGRWAVLSPAAGGAAPYVAALEPDAVYNARPEEAIEFSPQVLGGTPQPIPGPPEPPTGDPRDRLPPGGGLSQPQPGPTAPTVGDPRDRLPVVVRQ